ncbi:hypothetical protein CBL_08454 [Carabus blaptoides fortunei]
MGQSCSVQANVWAGGWKTRRVCPSREAPSQSMVAGQWGLVAGLLDTWGHQGPVRRSGGLLVWCGPPRWSGGPSGSEILWKCFGRGLRCALGARWVAVSHLDNPENPESLQDPRSSGGVLMEGCAARWEPVRVMWATWMTWGAFRFRDPLKVFWWRVALRSRGPLG